MIPAHDKPIEQLRQEVIDQLVLNYGHEKLSREAFERRLDQAYEAQDNASLVALAEDLENFQDSNYTQRKDHILYAESKESESTRWCINIFSGTQSNHEEIVPATIRIINIFGGAELDYSLARFSAAQTNIKVVCIFGGAEIHVPEGVKIRTRVIPLFGGCHNRGEPVNDPGAPLVIVTGLALFGGISIGIKRTFRERMQGFADDIKQMLS